MSVSSTAKPAASDLAEQIAPPKPGYATTEFWLTLIGSVFGILVGLHVIGPDFARSHEQLVNALALFASIIAPGLYAVSRGITKHAQTAAASVLNTRMVVAQAAVRDAGFALLALIGAILLVVGAIWLIVGLAHHRFDVFACITAAIGAVLIYFDGGWGRGRPTRF